MPLLVCLLTSKYSVAKPFGEIPRRCLPCQADGIPALPFSGENVAMLVLSVNELRVESEDTPILHADFIGIYLVGALFSTHGIPTINELQSLRIFRQAIFEKEDIALPLPRRQCPFQLLRRDLPHPFLSRADNSCGVVGEAVGRLPDFVSTHGMAERFAAFIVKADEDIALLHRHEVFGCPSVSQADLVDGDILFQIDTVKIDVLRRPPLFAVEIAVGFRKTRREMLLDRCYAVVAAADADDLVVSSSLKIAEFQGNLSGCKGIEFGFVSILMCRHVEILDCGIVVVLCLFCVIEVMTTMIYASLVILQ